MNQDDLAYCRDKIRTGSYSFHAASRLLPASVRDPALVLYAFCRVADDAVDLGDDKVAAVLNLRDRLDLVYDGHPRNTPIDRAFANVVETFDMPRALPEALLEGLAWDGVERRYETLSDVRSYSARVAAAVGAMMCVLMRARDADVLARACDLGVAMQLTNIARDVGEDAAAGRLYLPLAWFKAARLSPEAWLQDPTPCPEIRGMVRDLLAEAHRLYQRAEAGIGQLPPATRAGIFAARFIYAAIGRDIASHDFDSVTRRAHTNKAQKLAWIGASAARASGTFVFPQSARLHAASLSEVGFLVEAAALEPTKSVWDRRSDALLGVLAQLEMQDRNAKIA
ncbi:MAG: phytoene/squalene synthase family protein [Pseudomonadota bacterium]